MHKSFQELSKKIPVAAYEGYLWFSDQEIPQVLEREMPDFSERETVNPFIIEGWLYDKNNNTSILIRHSGKYHITVYQLNKLKEEGKLEAVTYLPHRLSGIKEVCFQQLWLPEMDFNCGGVIEQATDYPGMEVLTLKALIFTGFKKQ